METIILNQIFFFIIMYCYLNAFLYIDTIHFRNVISINFIVNINIFE